MFRSLTSWSTAWSHCWQMWETPSLQRTVCLTLTLPAGNWLFHTLFFYSGKDFMFFLLPRVKDHLIQRNFLSLSTPPPLNSQTPSHDRRTFARACSPERAWVSPAEPHDVLLQRARHPEAAAAACFSQWPPEGASGLSPVFHEGPAGKQLHISKT